MNNLTSFADFSKGTTTPQKEASKIAPQKVQMINEPVEAQTEELEADVASQPMEKPSKSDKKFVAHYEKLFGKKKPHEQITEQSEDMKPFKHSYEVVEKEYTSLLRELNRVEGSKPDMKKHVTELKKNFNDLLVKLQFLAEYKEPPKTEEKDK